jgi:hypothetical protein
VKPLRVGQHRIRATLQAPAEPESFDTFGQPIPNFVTIGTYWIFLRPLRGQELVIARQVQAQAIFYIQCRWLGIAVTISPEYRWKIGTRYFGIFDVRNTEERNRGYEMNVFEIQQPGPV